MVNVSIIGLEFRMINASDMIVGMLLETYLLYKISYTNMTISHRSNSKQLLHSFIDLPNPLLSLQVTLVNIDYFVRFF